MNEADGSNKVEAILVKGDHMAPAYGDGDIIYIGEPHTDANELLGRECVVTLNDGREMLRRIEAGESPGRFTLVGYGLVPICNVEVTSAAPVIWVRKADS